MKKEKEKIIAELLLKNYEKYYRIAFSYVHNEADALDIVQEGAYKAILHSEKLRKPEYADTWICRIIMNESVEYLRKNRANHVELEKYEAGKEETYEDIDLRKAIDRLSDQERTVVVLRFFEDMSLEQIAHAANENLNTVKSRLYRALGKLKIALEEA